MTTETSDFFLTTDRIELDTEGDCQIVDLSTELQALVTRHRLDEGSVLLFVPGSTAGLTTVEFEPGLVRDLPEFFERIIPQEAHYHHEDRWHDGNGHSHVRASLIGPSLTVPVQSGAPMLGTWQQPVLIDFDNQARRRTVIAQLTGRRQA